MRKVVDVPSETMASELRSGRASIVEGLSPVNGIICAEDGKLKRFTKYGEMFPKLPPPS